jgi:hypothetical protein
MHKATIISITLTMLIAALLGVAFADDSVAVKKDAWIEYQVVETGNPTPDYNITWARMDVTAVQGQTIDINVQTGYANGTIYPEKITLNLATGAIGDGFFVPTGLNIGDEFYSEYQGNIIITSVWHLEVGGAVRTVVSASSNQTTYYWDRQTGILVGATASFSDFTLFTTTSRTDVWQPQILGLDPTVFCVLISAIVVVLVTIVAILVWRNKVHANR